MDAASGGMECSDLERALEEYVANEDFGVLGDDSTDDDGPAITSDDASFVLRGQGRGTRMVICHGRSAETVRMTNKPVGSGFKLWALCEKGYV
jgi:hypothetical protein